MPADARREPPSDAGHGQGRPPDGPPEEGSWAFARGLKSMFGWPQQDAAPALPPLTASGLRAQNEDGLHAGGVHRLAAPSTQGIQPNVRNTYASYLVRPARNLAPTSSSYQVLCYTAVY